MLLSTLVTSDSATAAAAAAQGSAAAGGPSCRELAVRARGASRALQAMTSEQRGDCLDRMAQALLDNAADILKENAEDIAESEVC